MVSAYVPTAEQPVVVRCPGCGQRIVFWTMAAIHWCPPPINRSD